MIHARQKAAVGMGPLALPVLATMLTAGSIASSAVAWNAPPRPYLTSKTSDYRVLGNLAHDAGGLQWDTCTDGRVTYGGVHFPVGGV
jgi:hypothetical protein